MFHKRLIKEFRENQKNIWGMVLTQWVMLIANVVLMLQTATFIAGMVRGENLQNQSIRLLVTLAVVVVVRSLMSPLNSKLSFEASKQVKARLRTMVYEKMMRLGSSYKEYFQTSEVVQITTEGVEQLEIYFGKYMPQFFYSMLAPVTLFVIVGTMSLKVAVVLLICVPLIPLSIVAVQKFAKKMLAKYWGTYTEMGDSFLECLQGLTTLKIYQADERYAKRMDEEAEKFRKVTMRVLIMQLNSISIMDLVAYGGAAVGIILSILEYQKGVIGLAQCFFIIMISAEFFLPLRLLGSFFHIAMNGMAASDKMFRLLDMEAEEVDMDDKQEREKAGEKNDRVPYAVSARQVTFAYEEEQPILKEVTVDIPSRSLVSVVGASGCGKSTLASLFMGYQTAQSGKVLICGKDIRMIPVKERMKQMTLVSFQNYLFKGSVRENLLMGDPSATEEKLLAVLKKVNLYEFFQTQNGLDTMLDEQAANLSGGQKQRLCIARALLHDSALYIFDEATSNIDVESEEIILKLIRNLAREKTVIQITHRLANVADSDQIYMMEKGCVIEKGTQEELLEKQGAYADMYELQKALEQYREEAI